MAEVLTVLYDTTTGRCTHSGLTVAMPDAMRRRLTRLGVDFPSGADRGHLLDKAGFTAAKRGAVVQSFNDTYNKVNLTYVTDTVTLVLTSV